MRPEMDDREMADLERRLRRAVVGHEPQAPQSLVGFINTIPARYSMARGVQSNLDGPWIRRGLFAMVAVAAVILAIVGSAAIVAVRSGPNGGPGAPSVVGWTWQRADDTIVSRIFQVSHGYVGTCGQDEGLCSSPDGLHWTTPADPSIVAVDGGAYFVPDKIVRYGSIYLATGQSSSNANPSCAPDATTYIPTAVIWRSSDGVHWTQVDSPAFSGLTLTGVASLESGFLAYAAGTPDETGWALTSTDGSTWARASRLPVQPGISSAGTAGVVVGSSGAQWRTVDGTNWNRMTVPPGWSVGLVYRVPSGGFIALGLSRTGIGYQILTSADALTWRVDAGDLEGLPLALDSVGGRLFADVSSSPLNSSAYPDSSTFGQNAFAIWQSADSGRTWQPLLDASGNHMSGLVTTADGRLFISSPDPALTRWRVTWVGTPPGTSPVGSVTPAATDTPDSAATSSPAIQASDQAGGSPCDDGSSPAPSGGPLAAFGTPSWFPQIHPNLGGMSGWTAIGGYWGGEGYGCSFTVGQGMGSAVGVIGACDTAQILDVELQDETAGLVGPQRIVASFQVMCPLPLSSPQPVFSMSDNTRLGHQLQVQVVSPVPVNGKYTFLIQTTDAQPNAGPTATH